MATCDVRRQRVPATCILVCFVFGLGFIHCARHALYRGTHRRRNAEQNLADWYCPCQDMPAHSLVTYNVTPTLSVVANYGSKNCSAVTDVVCQPIPQPANATYLVEACALGALDIALPGAMTYQAYNWYHEDHRDWTMDVLTVYRDHLCSPGHYYNQPGQLLVSCDPDVLNLQHEGMYQVQGSILDLGADATGGMLHYMARYVIGDLVGYNLKHSYWRPAAHALFRFPSNFTFVFGDEGTCLPFKDNTFDFVYSINVLEHAIPWQRLLTEAVRVLKPGGLLYLQYYPLWHSSKGHHLGLDIVRHWTYKLDRTGKASPGCTWDHIQYANDASIIPDWAHLMWTKEHMTRHLNSTHFKTCPELITAMVNYVYDDPPNSELSRVTANEPAEFLTDMGLSQVKQYFWMDMGTKPLDKSLLNQLIVKYGHSNFFVSGAEYVFLKPAGWTMADFRAGAGAAAKGSAGATDAATDHKQNSL